MVCKICHKDFVSLGTHVKKYHNISPKEYYDKYLKGKKEGICLMYGQIPSCKKYTKFVSISRGYRHYCSCKCSHLDPRVKLKTKNTCIKRFGHCSSSKDPGMRLRCKETSIKNYGVEHPSKSNKVKEKFIKTNKKNFLNQLSNNLSEKNLELVDSEYINAHHYHTWKCLKCGNLFSQMWNLIQQGYKCPTCYPRNQGYSQYEIKIRTWFESWGLDFTTNDRSIISPKELDIFVSRDNRALEHNGIWFHSKEFQDLRCPDEDPKIKQLLKTELCTKKNIQLVHTFDDDIDYYEEELKKLLYKIYIENYDLLDDNLNHSEFPNFKLSWKTETGNLILNRRFSKNLGYYEKLGYTVKILVPELYPAKSGYTVWDVGYLEIKELRRTPLS